MPTFEVKVPVGANQIWMKKTIREAVAEATRRGKLRPNSVDSITGKNTRRQPRARHADRPLRAVGARRHRGEADPQGRRLREQQRAVRGADRTAAPRPRRPLARGRAQVHPARGVAGAGQGLRAGRPRRLHRRRSDVRLPAREGAVVPHARRRESRRSDWPTLEAQIMATVNTLGVGPDGLRRRRRRSSAARSARSTGCRRASSCRWPTTAGRSAGSASCSTRSTDASRSGSIATRHAAPRPMVGAGAHGLRADRARAGAARADRRGDGALAAGRRRRADLRAACTPAATPCTTT